MNNLINKRIFVSLRKIFKLFFIPEKDFEKKYQETRTNDIVSELMLIPVTERFKFTQKIKDKLLEETIKEKEELIKQLDKITKTLTYYDKI